MKARELAIGAVLAAVIVGLFAVGCGTASDYVAPITDIDERLAATETGDFAALLAEAESHWANRTEQAEVEAAIAAWERALHVETPGNRRADLYPVLVHLSRAYYLLADGHLRFAELPRAEREAQMKATYAEGIQYGQLAMSVQNEAWNRALLYETPIPEAVEVMGIDDVPGMYWYSTNMGKWAILDGTPTILAHKDDIAAIMGRIQDLDREFFYAASDRYFGAYYTKVPVGNPDVERARAHFEMAIDFEPNYFATRVLLADDYARAVQNRDLFVEQLEYVLNGDPDLLPDVAPENRIEQRKARELLDNVDEYFR